MKLKFLPIAILALSFTACDTYEETDDVANQRAEQEAFVKAENLKDAYNEYANAYKIWSNKSNSFTEIEKTINKYKQSLILLETGYDEATVKAMKESDKAEKQTELTIAQARLEILKTADIDVKALRTEIEAKNKEILALGDNENSTIFKAALEALEAWNDKYNEGIKSSFAYGKGYDADIWAEKAIVTKNISSIAVEQPKIDLDKFDEQLVDYKEAYDIALEAYTTAKIARDNTKDIKNAAQVDFDAAKDALTVAEAAEKTAQEAFDADNSNANKDLLDSAIKDVEDAQEVLSKATTELNTAIAAFNKIETEYYAAETTYEAETKNYESKQYERRILFSKYYWAKKAYTDFDIDALKAELTELNANYRATYKTNNIINRLNAEKAELENTMFFIEANYGNLEKTETYLKGKITITETKIKGLEKNISDLDKDLAMIAAGVFNLSDNEYTTDLTAMQIQEAIASYEAKLVASNELLAASQAQLDRAKAAYEALLAQYTEKADDDASSAE